MIMKRRIEITCKMNIFNIWFVQLVVWKLGFIFLVKIWGIFNKYFYKAHYITIHINLNT